MTQPRYILGIETSCDETSLALIELLREKNSTENFLTHLNSHTVIAHIIASQAENFAQYGGVIPEISARGHAEQIFGLFELLLKKAELETQLPRNEIYKQIETIAVTTEPGLKSALRVGEEFAKVVSHYVNKLGGSSTVLPTNHLHGHIVSAFFGTQERWQDNEVFPHLHLLVSGGNTQLLLLESPSVFTVVGQTIDDAAGECLDKIGRMVGLDYPAGGTIAKIVGERTDNPLKLPVSMKGKEGLLFSYSGLKTAVRYYIRDHAESGLRYEEKLSSSDLDNLYSHTLDTKRLTLINEILVSTQSVVVEQLINQTKKAIKEFSPRSLGLSGGVSANKYLRKKLSELHPNFFLAPLELTGDNAVMIALAKVSK